MTNRVVPTYGARTALQLSAFFVHTLCYSRITFDPSKNERNLRLRGLSFARVADFSFDSAVLAVDERKE